MEEFLCDVFSFIQNFSIVLIAYELLLCGHLPKRKHFIFRLIVPLAIALAFSRELSFLTPWREYGLFSKIPWLIVGDVLNFGFVIIFTLSVFAMVFCFENSAAKILSFCAMSYSAQNLTFHINLLIRHALFGGDNSSFMYRLVSQMVIWAVFVLIFLIFVDFYKRYLEFTVDFKFAVVFSLMMLVVVSVFSYWIYYFDQYNYMLGAFAIGSNLLLMFIHLSVFLKSKSDTERRAMEELFRKSEWQYNMYQTNIEIVNRKYHDLKYMLAALKETSDSAERASYITELERSIQNYDVQIQTGNKVLDALLTEKSYHCQTKGIEFTCLADGEAIAFMQTLDMMVLFGNAIDNAIEAEMKEDEKNRRISVNAKKKEQIVTVSIENYFSGTLSSSEKSSLRIHTTKESEMDHGFGLKSIKQITEKYEGAMQILTESNHFRLLLIFSGK